MKTCDVEGCEKTARSKSADWCAMHYHRHYRHGTTDRITEKKPPKQVWYTSTYKPGHDLANKWGNVPLHRYTLYQSIGGGPQACHWCATPLAWKSKGRDQLHVDHVNEDKRDNRIENLVPACRSCNTGRTQARLLAERKALGWWSNHDTVARLATSGRVADMVISAKDRIEELETALFSVDPTHPALRGRGKA